MTRDRDAAVTREWLVTNGLGGYASGTVPGVITRRYHGLLIAALPAPLGRIVMLSHVAEQITLGDGRRIEIGGRERTGDAPDAHGTGYLTEFRLEAGLPVWRYEVEGLDDREADFPSAHAEHRHVGIRTALRRRQGGARAPAVGELPPAGGAGQRAAGLAVRSSTPSASSTKSRCQAARCRRCASSCAPPTPTFTLKGKRIDNVLYPVEESRGYQARGDLWSPGYFRFIAARGRAGHARRLHRIVRRR